MRKGEVSRDVWDAKNLGPIFSSKVPKWAGFVVQNMNVGEIYRPNKINCVIWIAF